MKVFAALYRFLIFILIIYLPSQIFGAFPGDKSIDKKYYKMQEKADAMSTMGAMAVVGVAVESSSRNDLGRTKAKANAMAILSEQKEVYVESVIYNFKQSLGNGYEEKYEEVFRSVTKILSQNILQGVRIVDFDYYQSKENKKENKNTYLVILVVSPQYTFQSLFNELAESEDKEVVTLFEKFKTSDEKKTLDEKIENFDKKFGNDF